MKAILLMAFLFIMCVRTVYNHDEVKAILYHKVSRVTYLEFHTGDILRYYGAEFIPSWLFSRYQFVLMHCNKVKYKQIQKNLKEFKQQQKQSRVKKPLKIKSYRISL